MIRISRHITIPEEELQESFIRASGPGGQNVNKVATAVMLRFNVASSPSLPDEVRQRLMRQIGARLTEDGELVILARRYRSQEKNRADARERLAALIRRAAEPPVLRVRTRPSRAAREKRLAEKKVRSRLKSDRHRVNPDE
jgi:ribosome-associated protein